MARDFMTLAAPVNFMGVLSIRIKAEAR